MSGYEYLENRELDKAERLYDVSDVQMQVTAIGYMYGVDRACAEKMRDELPANKIADSYDYYLCRDLPTVQKLEMYDKLRTEREAIVKDRGLDSSIEAIMIRDGITDDFTKGVESIPEALPGDLIQ